jgi:type IV pilus assembly protein PilC
MAINIKSIKINQGSHSVEQGNSIAARVSGLLSKDINLFGNELKDKKKENFYSELTILLSSGIDIRTALDIIADEQTKEADRTLFKEIKSDVVRGLGLADAIFKSEKFSSYEFYSLKIGEESGRLKDVMADLAGFFSKKIKQQRQLTSALTYPTLVIITALVAVIFMLNFIVPMFVDVFKRFNGEMPPLTRHIIALSVFFKSYLIYMISALLLLAGILISVRKTEYFRARSSVLLMKLPLFGEIIQKIYLTRFCQSMALLLGAKTPMLRSLGLVKKMIGFYSFEKAIGVMEEDILHGKLLHQSMGQFRLFDTRIISLVRVAEEVNQLEVIFSKLNNQYNEELEHKIGMLSSLLEPAMIIIVGGLVSVILISMYLPLFQLSSSII